MAQDNETDNGRPVPEPENVASSGQDPASSTPAEQGAPSVLDAPEPARKGRIKPWMIAAVVAAVALHVGVGIAIFNVRRGNTYAEAMSYYEAGNYAAAADAFEGLGDYEDSSEWYAQATAWTEAQGAEKEAGEDPDAWEAAAKAYESVGEEGAKAEAKRCTNTATYYKACALVADDPEDTKVLDEAIGLFESCGGVLDADERLASCKTSKSYLKAKSLMKDSKWSKAYDAFKDSANAGYKDAKELRTECKAHVEYDDAEKLFSAGKFYEARQAYEALGKYNYKWLPDLKEKTKSCEQPLPEAGQVWRNDAYPDNGSRLTINNSGNQNAYYKLYIGDDLVITAFVPENGTAGFDLPPGTYRMNKGYGNVWYGIDDMFGDEGSYYTCTFGGEETATLEVNWEYEISTGTGGTGVGSHSADRESI